MVTQKGLDKDPDLAKKIDQAIFPKLQGGPHDHQTAAIAVALGQVMEPKFKTFAGQVVKNAKILAAELMKKKFKLVSNGTDNHMMLIDCGRGRGVLLQEALEAAGITVNKNTIPMDSSPFYPGGVRLGTPFITMRGMKAKEMRKIAEWISRAADEIKQFNLPENKEKIQEFLIKFHQIVKNNKKLAQIKREIKTLCKKFSVYR